MHKVLLSCFTPLRFELATCTLYVPGLCPKPLPPYRDIVEYHLTAPGNIVLCFEKREGITLAGRNLCELDH